MAAGAAVEDVLAVGGGGRARRRIGGFGRLRAPHRDEENAMRPYHVMPAAGRWEITREGEFDVLADFSDREEALRWAREQAQADDSPVVAHREDYSIEPG
jgi:hypothetical protein